MLLPQFQSPDRISQMLQSQWSAILNPIISNPLTNPRILKNISLINGVTVVPHGLQEQMQGWFIADVNASAIIYRSAPMNSLTLTLTSSAACLVTIAVY